MWALRRASSNSLKIQGLNVAAFRVCAGFGPLGSHTEDKSSASEQLHCFTHDRWITSKTCNCTVPVQNHLSFGCRSLSSKAGAKSGGEEDELEEGFSELEGPEASVTNEEVAVDSSSSSDSDSDSEVEGNLEETLETELLGGTEVDASKKESRGTQSSSPLLKLLLKEPAPSLSDALDKFAEDQEISHPDVYQALLNLRRRKLFGKALQLSEWFEQRDDVDFTVKDYASRVDLIAKARGIKRAETYIDSIPESYREELVYRTLLANSASATNVIKTEEIFNKMKDLGLPVTVFTCNQMLLLYKRTDQKKVADVLVMMEKENLQPSLFTYQILIDIKGRSNDVEGMEQILETMKNQGVEPNTRIKATLARHYAAAGVKEKAEAVLKEIEGEDLNRDHYLCKILLPIYADLRKPEEVERIWKIAETKPREADFISAIGAFGKLKNVEMAEAVFNKMAESSRKLTSLHYTIMLKVYAENKLLSKGKELLKKMGNSGCQIGPTAWDALIKLYVDAGEVEKADSVLQKAAQQNNQIRPLFSSYMTILDQYAKRGDVHNAEKTFQRMRQVGYVSRARPFHALLKAYINANAPAYGIRERMKADNIFPNKGLAAQLALVDVFRRTAVSDLLE